MDNYFRTIGLANIRTKNQIKKLNNTVLNSPDSKDILNVKNFGTHINYQKSFGNNMGVCLRGLINNNFEVTVNSLEPYFFTNNIIYVENVCIFKDGVKYFATCQEKYTGVEFSFFIQNVLDYLKFQNKKISQVNVVGLSKKSTIILNVTNKIKQQVFFDLNEISNLMKEFKNGDLDSARLLWQKSQKNNFLTKEYLKKYDFFSVVQSYLFCDEKFCADYNVLGEILEVSKSFNTKTNEGIFIFKIDINGIILEICVHQNDLLGYPMEGLRFFGKCWLQGKILY